MGCYDTVLVPCPKCGELYDAQSKSGDCLCGVFDFENTPSNVMSNVNRHAPFVCDKCKTVFCVKFNPKPEVVETEYVEDDLPDDLIEGASIYDLKKSMEDYYSKLDKK
jgi:endogenous inhibitor of DNA gyrase (YacG/DUF329 family)